MKDCKDKPKILIIIPARGGSVGVPRKNARLLNGKPLLCYALEAALGELINLDVVVSTDDEEIAQIAKSNGASVPFLRPTDISRSDTTLILVSKHALEYFDSQGIYYDAVMSLQPTNPFISTQTIKQAIDFYRSLNCTSVVTVTEFSTGHPFTAKRISEKGFISEFATPPEGAVTFPRQKREKAFYPNGAIYLRSKELINSYVSGGWQLGDNPCAVVMNQIESIDINYEIDFLFAEFLLQRHISNA